MNPYEDLVGSGRTPEDLADELGMDADDLMDELLEYNIEYCTNCGTWDESSGMLPYDEDEPDGNCTYCR